MAIAAGLHRRACDRLMREISRHHRRRAAKKTERVQHHALVALRQKFRDALGVGFRKDRDRVAIPGSMQLGVRFARDARLQFSALVVSLCAALQNDGPAKNGGKRTRRRRKLIGEPFISKPILYRTS
jgi:hypothetical protein